MTTPVDNNLTLPEVFRRAVSDAGEAVAVVGDTGSFTWRQWQDLAERVARGLQELGVAPGDVVAAQLPNSVEFLVVHVAAAMIGAPLLPVQLDCGSAELESLVRRTTPKVLILPARWRDRLGEEVGRALGSAVPGLGHVLLVDCAAEVPDSLQRLIVDRTGTKSRSVDVRPDTPLVMVASSGTTSARPKICVHSHAGLLANAAAVLADGGVPEAGDTMLCASPFSFLFGLLSVHVSILARARQAILRTWDRTRFVSLARETGPAVLFAVPTQLHDLVAELRADAGVSLTRMRQVRTGGAMVPEELVRAVTRLLSDEVVIQWGMSEVGAGTYTRAGDPPELVSRTVGRPVSGAQARVVGADGKPCAAGEIGALEFRSPAMFTGYHGDDELTERAFTADGWLRTGDLAAIDAHGLVTLHGRSTDLINVGGRKVNAVEIEQLLADLPSITSGVVAGRSDPRLGEVPVLVCVPGPGHDVTLDAVSAHLLAKGVAQHKLPVTVVAVDRLPHTPNGKIARHRVREIAARRHAPVASGGTPGEPDRERVDAALGVVCDEAAKVLGAPVTPDGKFTDQGFDSHAGVALRAALVRVTGLDLPVSLTFDCPTPRAVARCLAAGGYVQAGRPAVAFAEDIAEDEPVAIIGMSCRLPGGIQSPEQFWTLLADGGQALTDLPGDRGWPIEELYSTEPGAAGKIATRYGGFLSAVGDFDAEFFGITAREARAMDPQQRILLETTWEALDRCGVTTQQLSGSDASVFVGMMSADYAPRWFESPESYNGALGLGTAGSVASGRLAYLLGLHGPALTVDTACSSSLVALHVACQALRKRESGMAIVAGVTVMSSPANLVEFGRQGLLAPDGRCKPFGAGADGVGLAEGAGVVVLQRLSDARRQHRRVLAVVRGSAMVQDGSSNGLTAPNGRAQEAAIRRALRASRLAAADIDAVEAHGTGTALGDPIEAGALLATYGTDRPADRPLWLGSVKSNLGHTQAAAGIVSVIKMILALRHSTLPRTLHADTPSGEIEWSAGGLRLLHDPVEWPHSARPRRAGVSSFGISGTNVHVVLEEPPNEVARSQTATLPDAVVPWVLSAPDPSVLPLMADRLRTAVTMPGGASAAEVGNALANGRSLFPYRAAVLPDADGCHRAGLSALAAGTGSLDVVTGTALSTGTTVFIFPGHGSQWTGMAAQLMSESEVFAAAIEECELELARYVPWSLVEVLCGEPGAPRLDGVPEFEQSATFAVMVALAALWQSYGVRPDATAGHSQGEIAAAYVAGGLSLPDAVRLVTSRARVLSKIAGQGGMVSLVSDRDDVERRLRRWRRRLCVAVVNGPRSVVVSGDSDALAELLDEARREGIRATRVPGDIAFHSPQVDAALGEEFTGLVRGIRPRPERIPFFSATSAAQVRTERLTPDYWCRNLREPVNFHATTRALHGAGHRLFVEVGPHPVLSPAIEETFGELGQDGRVVTSLRRDDGGLRRFLRSLAEAHTHGATVDWRTVFGELPSDAGWLPTYPFRRRHYWLESTPKVVSSRAERPVAEDGTDTRSPTVPEALSETERRAELLALVQRTVASVLGSDGPELVSSTTDFEAQGLTSLVAVEVRNVLSATVGLSLPPTVVLDQQTPEKLADYLVSATSATAPAETPPEIIEAAPAERGTPGTSALPSGFESLYRLLCAGGHADKAWDMVGEVARLRSFFAADDELGSHVTGGFAQALGGNTPTLICFPSVVSLAGRAEYKNFAAPFIGARDVFQLDEIGFRDGEGLPADFDAMIAAHVEAVDRCAEGGPVVLCGRSFGGWIAHATAARMAATGRAPDGVVLLDTFWPGEEFIRKFIPRTLRRLVDRQNDLGTDLGMSRLTAIGWYLRMLARWQPEPSGVPTLYMLPEDQTSIEQHLRSGGWKLPHTEVSVPADHFSILDGDAGVTAEAVESWLSTVRPTATQP